MIICIEVFLIFFEYKIKSGRDKIWLNNILR